MKRSHKVIGLVATSALSAAILAACGGSGDDGGGSGGGGGGGTAYPVKTSQATVTSAGVKNTLANASSFVPSCTATGVSKEIPGEPEFAAVMKALQLGQIALDNSKKAGKTVALIPTTAPQSQNGNCGGSVSFPTWSHSSGTTNIAINFSNYCNQDSAGIKTTINGTLSAADNGTPSSSGPVTNNITANIPSLSVVSKNAAGTTLADDSISLTGFKYVPAAGASADISDLPGTLTVTSFVANNNKTQKSIKVENLSVTTTVSTAGDTTVSMTGRFYSGQNGYTDVSTTNLVVDSNQVAKSGTVNFTGANGGKAVMTVNPSPGSGQSKFTFDVNGTSSGTLTCAGFELL